MRRKKRRRHRALVGAPPGTLIADPNAPRPVVHLMAYGPNDFTEQPVDDLNAVSASLERWPVTWINVEGLGDAGLIARLGEVLHLHQLALEDAINVHQRPKVEQYADHLFIVARMVVPGEEIETEQVSLFLGRNYVVTFQEGRPGDCFDPLRDRIRKGVGHLREAKTDYLAYSLLDAVVDGYFPVLEDLGERLEAMEDEILVRPTETVAARVHHVRRELLALRRAIWPMRDAFNALIRDVTPLVTDETRLYLRDCHDHTLRIIDFLETSRELGSDLMDLYLSSASQRMTEVMKVLTIIATIFIPLTFISSIYGMNFHTDESPWNMPELAWYFGYPFALSLMAAVSVGLIWYFRWKGWLGPPRPGERRS